jgi:hypothetical protein
VSPLPPFVTTSVSRRPGEPIGLSSIYLPGELFPIEPRAAVRIFRDLVAGGDPRLDRKFIFENRDVGLSGGRVPRCDARHTALSLAIHASLKPVLAGQARPFESGRGLFRPQTQGDAPVDRNIKRTYHALIVIEEAMMQRVAVETLRDFAELISLGAFLTMIALAARAFGA